MFELLLFFLYTSTTIIIYCLGIALLEKGIPRLFLSAFVFGYFLYSGAGGAYKEVGLDYYCYYTVLLIFIVFGYVFFRIALNKMGKSISLSTSNDYISDTVSINKWIIPVYILFFVIPLIYPEFKLKFFFTPPSPDLRALFSSYFKKEQNFIFVKIIQYGQMLLAPFFYIALYQYRKKTGYIIFIFALILYLQYLRSSYIGRGTILMYMVMIFMACWIVNTKTHKKQIIIGLIIFIITMVFFNYYESARLGIYRKVSGVMKEVQDVISKEISYPRKMGIRIIHSANRVDIFQYLKWILTLPIPKIFIGEVDGARVNYEISEIVLGISRNMKGFYVVLPGLVGEAVYIGGEMFFWLHGLFIAFLAAFFSRLVESKKDNLFLTLYLVYTFGYLLNRAGIGSILGNLINGLTIYYLYLIVVYYRWKKKKIIVKGIMDGPILLFPHKKSDLTPDIDS